jgi:hypothetical protein
MQLPLSNPRLPTALRKDASEIRRMVAHAAAQWPYEEQTGDEAPLPEFVWKAAVTTALALASGGAFGLAFDSPVAAIIGAIAGGSLAALAAALVRSRA